MYSNLGAAIVPRATLLFPGSRTSLFRPVQIVDGTILTRMVQPGPLSSPFPLRSSHVSQDGLEAPWRTDQLQSSANPILIPVHPPPSVMEDWKRRRAFGRRSRAGCRTCRVRKIKCDETPGACVRCTSTGRQCEYDLTRLPVAARGRARPIWPQRCPRPLSIQPGATADERRCFGIFTAHTVPMMVCWFDSEVWQRIVLQMSHAEPAVYHTVVALSALHEDGEVAGRPPGQLDLTNHYHRFALEQYGKALALLRQRLHSQDPHVRELALMCCINFICFELFRHNYGNAFLHLQNGAKILHYQLHGSGPSGGESPSSTACLHPAPQISATELALTKVFVHLDTHSAQFGQEGPLLRLPLGVDRPRIRIRSALDAKQQLDPILSNILRFRRSCEPLLCGAGPGGMDLATAMMEQAQIRGWMTAHMAALDDCLRHQVLSALSRKERRGVDVMRMQQVALLNILDTSLVTSEMIYDRYLGEFQTITRLADGIIASFAAEHGHRRTTVAIDMGVIPSLFWVCLKCRHQATRHRALELLDAWPHREGAYDGRVMATLAREHIARESRRPGVEGAGTVIPESARVGSVNRVASADEEAAAVLHS
ncbi:hypothetical protein ASPCADRAFT_517952 [Aspergillus carbonarius ITEM 5010]|uniref:Zn(2)-C6 fungal-type domain-containing protein n=1 Tax=Aspergillus carbonarius (strain ITEM 5010) TaxID=602072 RepID=A0A1R3RC28_ASPC5|nr:hypothetical protein ASPCADRAFT_517952 [Aspergillus carbonarius ITEM 5010]